MASKDIVADACFLLNLLATDRPRDLVLAADASLATTERALREVCYLQVDGSEGIERVSVDAIEAIGADRLRIEVMFGKAQEEFVRAAQFLRDADASVVALAAAMGKPLATDDGRVCRILREQFGTITRISTLEFLRTASSALNLSESELRHIAAGVRFRGRFDPPRTDPFREWFLSLLIR